MHLRSAQLSLEDAESTRLRSAWVDGLADALVVTDTSGRVLMCNPAFMQLCTSADGHTVYHRSLTALLGDPAHSLARALQTARSKGMAHLDAVFTGHHEHFGAANETPGGLESRRDSSAATPVAAPPALLAVSAVMLGRAKEERIGLRLRKLTAGPAELQPEGPLERLASAIGQLADDMGLVRLPELMRKASALAERHLIEQALRRCQWRPVETADLLGIPVARLRQRMLHLGLTGTAPDLNHSTTEDPRQH